jgi:exopolyphosphatase/guanosine-5'-triphosphate,3'-diphosphate pyrophosphatase
LSRAQPPRFATIDVGTNTVLLLVAERRADGSFAPLAERAEITRLGRGVDRTGRLEPAAIRDTVDVVARYAAEARALGAGAIACVATSAARDAANGAEFFDEVRARAGVAPEVVSGDEEARLVWASAWSDFGEVGRTLAVLDVGGGSTELVVGDGPAPRARRSVQLGAVRLTERVVTADPIPPAELERLRADAARAVAGLPLDAVGDPRRAALVGVAGTVTTLSAVAQALPVYDAGVVHGATLDRATLEELWTRLGALTIAARAALPGMEPKRADVIVAGAAIVLEMMAAAGFDRLTVSDRGVRWGLLHDRFGR